MNNKGFTLVEILAVVAILSIMSGVAVAGVSKYLLQSKSQAYESMEKSAYDAIVNYVMEHNIMLSEVTSENLSEVLNRCGSNNDQCYKVLIKNLVDEDYLENPIDPNKNGELCTSDDSYVQVVNFKDSSNDEDAIGQYKYYIHISCPSGYTSDNIVYPKD